MNRVVPALAAAVMATPAPAASKNPFSAEFYALSNTDFIVSLAFILFLGVLWRFGAPRVIAKALDDRADGIRAELEEARALREEAQALLATCERRQADVRTQADEIIASAKAEAEAVAEQAKADIARSVERRLSVARDRIASAEAAAVKEVRHQAIAVAIGAAADMLADSIGAAEADRLIDAGVAEVEARLLH